MIRGLTKGGGRPGLPLFLLALAFPGAAQDLHTVTSPDGQLRFQLFVTEGESGLPRIAYRLDYRGRPMLETSYLGFDIEFQEPILGEKAGLMSFSAGPHSLVAHYMQDGSIGRLLDIEVRAWNDGVAFRYVIPVTAPLKQLQIMSELTEFAFPVKPPGPPTVPFTTEVPGAGWISIGEEGTAGSYPRMALTRSEDEPKVLITHFDKVWESVTPFTTPWRVIGVGATREAALDNRRTKGEY